jgi:hypothetical protein
MASISKRIEEFATEKLRSIVGTAPTTDGLNTDSQQVYLYLVCSIVDPTYLGKKLLCNVYKFFSQDPVWGIAEAQQCMSLYFALCTKVYLK